MLELCSIASGSSGNCICVGTDDCHVLIDAGISGITAAKVAKQMNIIGKNRQVICITHLPQIAAMADTHYLIEKKVEDARTITRIERLDEEGSVRELARILGGDKITDSILGSAQEMKELVKSEK